MPRGVGAHACQAMKQAACQADHTCMRIIHTWHLQLHSDQQHFVSSLQVSKASPCWKTYVDYVSDIVIQGFSNAITASTHYLLQQLDPEVLAK